MFLIVSSVGKTPLEKALQYSKIGTVMFLLQADCQRSPNLIKSEKIRELCTMYPPLTMFMDHEFNQPWSLLRLCRYNIRNAIERDKLKDIPEQLLLPRTLLNYVTLNENVWKKCLCNIIYICKRERERERERDHQLLILITFLTVLMIHMIYGILFNF